MLAEIAAGLCLVSCGYQAATVVALGKWKRRSVPPPLQAPPPISILKPLCGVDPELEANLESYFLLDYPEFQLVFGALNPDDPALSLARSLAQRYPHVDCVFVSGGNPIGLNLKVSNLVSMLPTTKYSTLVLSDSDMRIAAGSMRRLAAELDDPHVGLITCLYKGIEPKGFGAWMEGLAISTQFAPSTLVAALPGPVRFAFGSLIMLRAEDLREIGGFESLAEEIADDYLLGNRVAALCRRVVISSVVIDDVLGSEPATHRWARRVRWAKSIRAMQPVGHAGSLATHTTVFGLAALILGWGSWTAWIGIAGLVIRLAAAALALVTLGDNLGRRGWPLLFLSDLMNFGVWAASYWGRTVVWRGRRFRLERGGRLAEQHHSE